MINLLCARQIRNRILGRKLPNKCDSTYYKRTFQTQKRHYEPEELSWQWKVKNDPAIYHSKLTCINRICPKKTFFPRFHKVYVPAEIYPCEKKVKPMTWSEYFSYLLPDYMNIPKPPIRTCRKLLALRQDICLNPQDWICCNINNFKQLREWYGQGVVHALVSNVEEVIPPPEVKPCPPPDYMIPRCVIAKRGIQSSKESKNILPDVYKEPFGDFKGFPTKSKINKYVCKYKCFPELPKSNDKSLKLTCRYYAEFKEVECPRHMYTRYKDVVISPTGEIKPLPVSTEKRVEVKKAICGRKSFLRPAGVRFYSTSGNSSSYFDGVATEVDFSQPRTSVIIGDNLIKRAGFEPSSPHFPEPVNKPFRLPHYYRSENKSTKSDDKKTSSLKDKRKSLSDTKKKAEVLRHNYPAMLKVHRKWKHQDYMAKRELQLWAPRYAATHTKEGAPTPEFVRKECFPRSPPKLRPNNNGNKIGILCKIAQLFGFGCGKQYPPPSAGIKK